MRSKTANKTQNSVKRLQQNSKLLGKDSKVSNLCFFTWKQVTISIVINHNCCLFRVLQHLGQEHLPFEHPDVVHYENEMGYEMKLLWAEVTWQKQVLQQSMDIFFPMERMWQVAHWEATKLQWVFLNISFTDFFLIFPFSEKCKYSLFFVPYRVIIFKKIIYYNLFSAL